LKLSIWLSLVVVAAATLAVAVVLAVIWLLPVSRFFLLRQ
jgi:hypothetical protein